MRIMGRREDGTLAVSIGDSQVVLYQPDSRRVSRPREASELSLKDFAPTDSSFEARMVVRKGLETATFAPDL